MKINKLIFSVCVFILGTFCLSSLRAQDTTAVSAKPAATLSSFVGNSNAVMDYLKPSAFLGLDNGFGGGTGSLGEFHLITGPTLSYLGTPTSVGEEARRLLLPDDFSLCVSLSYFPFSAAKNDYWLNLFTTGSCGFSSLVNYNNNNQTFENDTLTWAFGGGIKVKQFAFIVGYELNQYGAMTGQGTFRQALGVQNTTSSSMHVTADFKLSATGASVLGGATGDSLRFEARWYQNGDVSLITDAPTVISLSFITDVDFGGGGAMDKSI